jgi:hypothetical protein
MCWATPGGTLRIYHSRSRRGVSFTKRRESTGGQEEVVVALEGEDAAGAVERLRGKLALIGFDDTLGDELTGPGDAGFVLKCIPQPEALGRVADLGLEAMGMNAGDRVIHEFSGEIDMDAVKEYWRTNLRR